jgi:hypothetical protein
MLNLKQRLRKRRQRPPLTLPVSADDYAYDDTYTRSDNIKNNNNNYDGSISLTPFTSAGNHAVTPTDLLPLDESPPQQHHRHTPSTDSTNSSALFEANASISRLHSSPSTSTLSTVHQLHTQSLQHRHRQHITVDAKVVLVGSQAVGKTSIARYYLLPHMNNCNRYMFGDVYCI